MEIFSHWKDGKELDDDATISTTRPKKKLPRSWKNLPRFLENLPRSWKKLQRFSENLLRFWGGKYPLFFTFHQSLSKGDECSHINSRDNPIPIA